MMHACSDEASSLSAACTKSRALSCATPEDKACFSIRRTVSDANASLRGFFIPNARIATFLGQSVEIARFFAPVHPSIDLHPTSYTCPRWNSVGHVTNSNSPLASAIRRTFLVFFRVQKGRYLEAQDTRSDHQGISSFVLSSFLS